MVADKMRLAAEVELKTKQSKELVAVIRRLLYLVHTRLMDDAVDCEIQNIYHEISGILYPRDPVAH